MSSFKDHVIACLGLVPPIACIDMHDGPSTMRFGSTAKVLLKCKLKYYRISECRQGQDIASSLRIAGSDTITE